MYKLEVDNVEVNATSTSVKVSANYSYPTEIGEVWMLVSGESGMGDALESAAVVEDNKLTGTVSGLLPSTKYYFCFRYNTGLTSKTLNREVSPHKAVAAAQVSWL